MCNQHPCSHHGHVAQHHDQHHERIDWNNAVQVPPATRRAMGRRAVLVGMVGVSGTALIACQPTELARLAPAAPRGQTERLGLETWDRIRRETPVSRNQGMQSALNNVGRRIIQSNNIGGSWEFVVFQGGSSNAFAVPGGKVGFYEGIFTHMENDAQLATVVGHEIAHNTQEHAAQRLGAGQMQQLGLAAVSAALGAGNIGYANEIAALLGAGVEYGIAMPFGREQELEADRVGTFYMARAGYDPRQSIAFWQSMQSGRSAGPEWLSTHPAGINRIQQLEALMPDAMRLYQA
jgi:predicted Zn-dependent protease